MRADRLVAALLVLQARGRVTAGELAEELEISERTARRDLEALAMAGIPVYSQAGRGGGWSLIGGARTDLSGLSAAEARALFLVAGPSSSATPAMKAALRKLVQALPETFRAEAEAAASAVLIDEASWDRTHAPRPEHLDALQEAVVAAVQVELGYVGRDGRESQRTIHPLGLVAKGSVWYLVAGTDAGQRTFRVDRVRSLERTERRAERPDGFDLAEVWQSVVEEVDRKRAPILVRGRAEQEWLGIIRSSVGRRLTVGDDVGDGWFAVEIRAHGMENIAVELAGFVEHLIVEEPAEVREHFARLGAALTARYAGGSPG